jgi:LmbE family N-acetylglucosaminyl deacetylase
MQGKKLVLIPFLFIVVLLSCLWYTAKAEESADITLLCHIGGSYSKKQLDSLSDRKLNTIWLSEKERTTYLSVETPQSQPCFGLYLCSAAKKPQPVSIQVLDHDVWTTVGVTAGLFAHEYIAVNGLTNFRIIPAPGASLSICLSEIYILGAGTVPAWVQQWSQPPDRTDLMILAAHPDDELLFFGGALPYYAGSLKKNVMVAYMTCNTIERRSELLNGLWACGVRIYPDIGDFYDKYTSKLDVCYAIWGKTTVMQYVTSLIRRYKPSVILSHDINGEYGHGAHRLCADAVSQCIGFAADPEKYRDSVKSYGIWQVKKLYLHLYAQNAITMNWDNPLTAFSGLTGYEVAVKAYQEHVSQLNAAQKNKATGKYEKFIVEPQDQPYSSYRFGLVFSAVGPDIYKDDFLENIH